jgi:hypothetical protein
MADCGRKFSMSPRGRFAQAADIEQRLSERCRAHGLRTEAWVHRFRAAGCGG